MESRGDREAIIDAHKAEQALSELQGTLVQMELVLASEWAQSNWIGYPEGEEPDLSSIEEVITTLKSQIEQLETNMYADRHQGSQRK